MPAGHVVISLPVADRPRARDFYEAWLQQEAVGPLADDGVPEPLQFPLNDGARLVLVPPGGFGWALAGRAMVAPGVHEALLSVSVADPSAVGAVVERARAAGAEVLAPAEARPWGYCGVVADPDGHAWQVVAETTVEPSGVS